MHCDFKIKFINDNIIIYKLYCRFITYEIKKKRSKENTWSRRKKRRFRSVRNDKRAGCECVVLSGRSERAFTEEWEVFEPERCFKSRSGVWESRQTRSKLTFFFSWVSNHFCCYSLENQIKHCVTPWLLDHQERSYRSLWDGASSVHLSVHPQILSTSSRKLHVRFRWNFTITFITVYVPKFVHDIKKMGLKGFSVGVAPQNMYLLSSLKSHTQFPWNLTTNFSTCDVRKFVHGIKN